ncbi:hypothetical protein BDN71DRAFT_1591214 [Pleurotus eryngii]|uniref:Uncharacterized protein n=1 Tax=Pleurotus eryngii TaxID=5323 RepID=A0A9P5ZWS6_PLEER|nr:hypothetical protein BDN71DRAFT_1591214 [Pleurotus eryngii]
MANRAEAIDLTTPPRKRARHDDEGSSPSKYSVAYSSSARSPQASLRSVAKSTPSDSPTNPFGLSRLSCLSKALPEVSSFAQHLALRFQLVQCYSSVFKNDPKERAYLNTANTLRRDREGVFRVVQVPLNYTFLHLHRLIYFLFGAMGREQIKIFDDDEQELRCGTSSIFTRNRKRKRSSDAAFEDEDPGHMFQVLKDLTMQIEKQKPGEIRKGQVVAKLSNAYEDDMDSVSNEMEDGCDTWRVEEDLHLSSVWPSRCSVLDRGIVYSHSQHTQIHITVNVQKIPSRKGRTNTPYVFFARGLVRLPGYEKYLRPGLKDLESETIDQWLESEPFNQPGVFEKFHAHACEVDAPLPLLDLPVHSPSSRSTTSFRSSSAGPSSMPPDMSSFASTPSSFYDSSFDHPSESSMSRDYSSEFPFSTFPQTSPLSTLKSRLNMDTPYPSSETSQRRARRMEKMFAKDKRILDGQIHKMRIKEAKARELARLAKERKEKAAREKESQQSIERVEEDADEDVDQLADEDGDGEVDGEDEGCRQEENNRDGEEDDEDEDANGEPVEVDEIEDDGDENAEVDELDEGTTTTTTTTKKMKETN